MTSKVLASVTVGILQLGSCHSILISKHLKSQCHTRDKKVGRIQQRLFFFFLIFKLREMIHGRQQRTQSQAYEAGKCCYCGRQNGYFSLSRHSYLHLSSLKKKKISLYVSHKVLLFTFYDLKYCFIKHRQSVIITLTLCPQDLLH